jgi:hypothetical protein
MSLAILFHFLCAQHVSDINISIIRSLRLCWWITSSVVLFSVLCVLEILCGWFWVVFVLQAEAQQYWHLFQICTEIWNRNYEILFNHIIMVHMEMWFPLSYSAFKKISRIPVQLLTGCLCTYRTLRRRNWVPWMVGLMVFKTLSLYALTLLFLQCPFWPISPSPIRIPTGSLLEQGV